jgi:nitrogen fixation protein NifB
MRVMENHPCYSHLAHFKYARIHLPVAQRCNLGCNYCERQIGGMTYHSYRPALTDRILTPKDALSEITRYVGDNDLAVVGIAGPGEPLCNQETFETLSLIHNDYPGLMLCLSTNGLLLPKYAERLKILKVRTLTVTLNTVSPEIGAMIYAYVRNNGEVLKGIEGAQMLLHNQLAGIEKAVRLGLMVKVNSILIPGINDNGHLEKVAKTVKELGVCIQNITPLIPLGRFRKRKPPSYEELCRVRIQCEKHIKQFRLCRQCRADAKGIPGKENFNGKTKELEKYIKG